ncbi:MAG: trypsin-like peptidase domain-containing protein [Chloracidobacterium sp.]
MLSCFSSQRLTLVLVGLALATTSFFVRPVPGVVILDSAWRKHGGNADNKPAGFAKHIALANQPQFRATIQLVGESAGASGTWIGNDAKHGYVLTAGHNFTKGGNATEYAYVATDGTTYKGVELIVHPAWNGDNNTRTGYDFAIVVLDRPVRGVGQPALLYAGSDEMDRLCTIVGYGMRGTGSSGEQADYYDDDNPKAAAQNLIENVTEAVKPLPSDEDGGNYLGIDFDKEDGSAKNTYGDPTPVNEYEGALGSGDSGGSCWMEYDRQWCVIGVNANGDTSTYGAVSYFARVSGEVGWIKSVFPGAKFIGN